MTFILFYNVYSSCEYKYNLYHLNLTNSSLIEEKEIPELLNSITSIFTSLLGFTGIFVGNNYLYNSNMNILIILGLSSALHHYFYKNIIFWDADILAGNVVV